MISKFFIRDMPPGEARGSLKKLTLLSTAGLRIAENACIKSLSKSQSACSNPEKRYSFKIASHCASVLMDLCLIASQKDEMKVMYSVNELSISQ